MRYSTAIRSIRAFNRFYTNRIGVVDRHILDSPFSLTEVRILFEIYHDRGVTARRIREFLRVDEGYLSRTLNALVRRGLVSRTQSHDDGRRYLLSLTPRGKSIFLGLNGRSESEVAAMIRHLSARGVRELVAMMSRIQELLGKDH